MQTTVADVMTLRVIAARENAEFKYIVEILRANRVSALPVVDGHNRVLGVVSETDLLVKEAENAPHRAGWRLPATERKAAAALAGELMTSPAVTIGPDAPVAEAAALMSARRVGQLPVVNAANHLIGVISQVDVLSVYCRPDYDIHDEIVKDIVAGELALGPDAFDVSVTSGIVTITGQAPSHAVAIQLVDAVRHVEGIVSVRNRITCLPGEPTTPERSTAMEPTVEQLTEEECLRLISPGGIGRVAFTGRYGLTVLPVNYRVHNGSVMFRTAHDIPTGEDLRTGIVGAEYKVAFEIDAVDETTQEGWSVLIHGPAHHMDTCAERETAEQVGIEPWVGWSRDDTVSITPTRITGRRIHHVRQNA